MPRRLKITQFAPLVCACTVARDVGTTSCTQITNADTHHPATAHHFFLLSPAKAGLPVYYVHYMYSTYLTLLFGVPWVFAGYVYSTRLDREEMFPPGPSSGDVKTLPGLCRLPGIGQSEREGAPRRLRFNRSQRPGDLLLQAPHQTEVWCRYGLCRSGTWNSYEPCVDVAYGCLPDATSPWILVMFLLRLQAPSDFIGESRLSSPGRLCLTRAACGVPAVVSLPVEIKCSRNLSYWQSLARHTPYLNLVRHRTAHYRHRAAIAPCSNLSHGDQGLCSVQCPAGLEHSTCRQRALTTLRRDWSSISRLP